MIPTTNMSLANIADSFRVLALDRQLDRIDHRIAALPHGAPARVTDPLSQIRSEIFLKIIEAEL